MIRNKFFLSVASTCIALAMLAGPAAAEKTLKVGIIGPFTGPSAKSGAEFKGAVTMAFEQAGNKVGDYTLEPVWVDSQSDPAKVVSAYAEACERIGIQAGVLNWHSSTAVAAMDVAAQYQVPHMFGFGATEVVNQKWQADPEKYSFWGGKGWPIPGKLMAGYAETIDNAIASGKFKPAKKVIAIACEDTDWGHSAGDSVAAEFEKRGWEIAGKDYFPITQTDFYPMLGKYKKKDVAVIFSTSTAAPVTTAFIKQIREVGMKSLIIIDGLGWSGEWYKMAGAASDGVLDMIPQLTTQAAKDWAVEFEKRFDMKPSPSAGGLSYDGSRFFVKILKRTLEKYGELDKTTIHKVMVEEVNTGKLTYSKADGAIIMNEYRYNGDTMPDPVVARDGYFFPVIQYKTGKGSIVYPEDWAEAEFMAP
ncbi:ABC transporter substrate-binding protein [Desulforhopalus singaporensis]|uniref:Branched-chain amino acid transport system substrate-binding protein n=1 Tax=Desulforhopalus singaporensis TaxID=91360 RepID=A0A1H0U2T1_9BACT|nr:ABC transporter substrate-binding protein [Desulforhopalus singaporensis]SDP60451.1 branched-chain amino acid transport system substrate-binding protein [Desulforhopalus singaporensis]